MPQFAPGEVRSAIAPITVQPAGLSCTAELYLVSDSAKVATSGIKSFTSTGAKQEIGFPVTMPGAEGSYPVWLDVLAEGMLIGAFIATEDVVIAPPIGPTISASWQTYFVSGTLGGQLVVATITVSAPKAFIGKVEVSLPGKISGDSLYTPEQWQALIAHYQWLLDNYCPTLADPWRCTHTYELGLERIRGWPTIEGFYLSASGIDDYAEFHIENLNKTSNTKSRNVEFPQGETQVTLAFFIPADEAHYNLYEIAFWCIAYKGASLTPEVKLYEYLNPYYDEKGYLHGNLSQLYSVTYEDAIQFGEQYNGNECALAWSGYPISAEFPSVIRSGEEFWASHTVYISYRESYAYYVELYVPIGSKAWILTSRYYNCDMCYCRSLRRTGEVTFKGVIECYWEGDISRSRVVPAGTEYNLPWGWPVPPGTYRVKSRCRSGRPTYGGWAYIWDEDTGMDIRVV